MSHRSPRRDDQFEFDFASREPIDEEKVKRIYPGAEVHEVPRLFPLNWVVQDRGDPIRPGLFRSLGHGGSIERAWANALELLDKYGKQE